MKVLSEMLVVFALMQGANFQTPPKIHYQLWISEGRIDPLRDGEDPPGEGADSAIRSSLSFSSDEWVDLNDSNGPKIGIQEIRNHWDLAPRILEYCVILSSDVDSDGLHMYAAKEGGVEEEYKPGKGLVDFSKNLSYNRIFRELPWEESDRKRSRLRVWGLAPDFVMGPLDMGIGSNRLLHRAQVEAQTLLAKPRTSLPEEFQPSERTWTDLGVGASVIPEGIQISWDERDPEYPKLLVAFNLPWNTRDQVKLDLDPFILEGLDVPEGIKMVRIIGMTRAGPLTMNLALPAVSNGLGRCFGRVTVDLAKTNHFHHWSPITSIYAVSRGELAGPLPGLPKAFPKDSWN
ncbi:MAG: hypothetical protein IPK50_12085 [Fibrobacterota bacterium]|nr:hypothetical protein [Fibrobacterota bacterium]QQS03052.1 MAG: hypothetical protein IPK50_12085 [Fibrobacterota bacterium]